MSVSVEHQDRVTTVIIDRPEVRNAVDRETADALAAAFRAFDADTGADVAVLWGAGGHFCATARTWKALAQGKRPNRVEPEGDGLARSHPHAALQAGDRRRGRARRGRRPGVGPVVRPAGGGGRRAARRVLPPLGACPWSTAAPSACRAPDRPVPGPGPDPHRPRRRCRRSAAHGLGQPRGAGRARRAPRRGNPGARADPLPPALPAQRSPQRLRAARVGDGRSPAQ